MYKRMSDEDLYSYNENQLPPESLVREFLQALKAERKYAETMEATLESANECHDAIQNDAIRDIEELQAKLKRVKSIGFETHPSWGCSDEFNRGWKACREQMKDAIK